ncbi:excisionase family DNA-binding protein [Rhizobium favelukesii]|uniref:excisionase family DNA-binding protein n=1 Tax=Rhizobium TaxID=379 RepID=UPI000B1E01B0|nr:excisionase family DNA-binding protein [Rhizobium favelukesii]
MSAPLDEDHRPFTPKSLAERWLCSERHVRNMLAAGQLPYFRLGGKLIRIKWADVDHFERNQGSRGE